MQEEIRQLKQEVAELKQLFNSLQASTTIPFNIDAAFRRRLGLDLNDISGKTPLSATLTFLDGNLVSKDAAEPMDGFLSIVINGRSYNVPFYI